MHTIGYLTNMSQGSQEKEKTQRQRDDRKSYEEFAYVIWEAEEPCDPWLGNLRTEETWWGSPLLS